MEWIVQLPLVLFSVIVHELAHGWTAFAKGDRTAEEQGRLTLSPLPHVDAFGTVFVPLLCRALGLPMFGWAKPVPVDPSRLRGPRDAAWVAAAGPGANLALAVAFAVGFKLVGASHLLAAEFERTLLDALLFGVSINLALAFFNLLPIQPLDGSKALAGLLPAAWRAHYERAAPYGGYVLLGLVVSRWIDPLVVGPSRLVFAALLRAGLVW